MPKVADGIPVRWVDPGAPWASQVGVRNGATRHEAALAARVALLYRRRQGRASRESQEYEVVLHPLSSHFDPGSGIAVDYDDRDLTVMVTPTRTNVKIVALALAWLPVL
jgi:hypothetical protein